MASSSSPSPLTFGIEIEGIFAFHQSRLEKHLSSTIPTSTIIKTLNPAQEQGLRQVHYPQHPYNSWAISNAGENDMTIKASVEHGAGSIRAYKDEPLHLVKEVLLSTSCAEDVMIHNPVDHSKPEEYTRWMVTSDHSLTSFTREEKAAYFTATKEDELDSWDTSGIELVSPPYSSIDMAQDDIAAIVASLTTQTTSITTNTSCGLHVHIGTPSGAHLPLKTLQHLSHILLIYEDEISRLHPGHRRQRPDEIVTNRENFYAEGDEPVERSVVDEETSKIVTKKFDCTYKALESIRRSIFDEVDAAENGLHALQLRVGMLRGHIVNFALINRKSGPQTIEFRQHAGSIDAVEIAHWVGFCMGLVRLAERYAAGNGSCRVKTWDDEIDIEDLFEEIGLGEEGKLFYRGRIEKFSMDGPGPVPLWADAWVDDEEDLGEEMDYLSF
jgi:hypothetical protein